MMMLEDCEIISIEDIECDDKNVYNLEVEDNHNYFANDILVSNCHVWRSAAANALLKILEEPPRHAMFILATTEIQKIIPTIQSRCQRFDLRKIKTNLVVDHLDKICQKEGVEKIEKGALSIIAKAAGGSLRDALSILDPVITRCGKEITTQDVSEVVGATTQEFCATLLDAIVSRNHQQAIFLIKKEENKENKPPEQIFRSFMDYVHNLLIGKCLDYDDHVSLEGPIKEQWHKQRDSIETNLLNAILIKITESMGRIDFMPRPDIVLDACIVDIIENTCK